MKLLHLLFFSTAMISCGSQPSVERLLTQSSGRLTMPIVENWSFRAADSINAEISVPLVEWMAATVPGTVHTDLMDRHVIEEPFASTAEKRLQWIEHQQWDYQTTFTADQQMFAEQVQELVFKGLDTYADVFLNDSLVLCADNMFLEWRVKVNGILKSGDNRLLIKFYPAYEKGFEKAAQYSVKLPADNDKGEVKTSVFTRKAPYHFGWDWGPRYATVGVWKPVYLEAWSTAQINNVQYIEKSQSDKLATFDANITITATGKNTVTLLLCDSAGTLYASQDVDVEMGENRFTLPFEIKDPKLWWPNGTGKANLYSVVTILAKCDEADKLDSYAANIGVRTIKLLQPKDSTGGGSAFYFEVNGEPVFAKGANFIPLDVFLPRVTAARYEEFLKVCKESNYNMIRVWGGGIYEDDVFYDLCDKYGIMVWQDFTFGCSLYPWDKEFLASVEKEAVYNVRRLRNHPSLAIWCGNNEITELWEQWGVQKQFGWSKPEQDTIYKGMRSLFYELLPSVLQREDTTRFYHPSSPLHGRGDVRSQTEGDVHYWGVFHDEEPFSTYKDKPGRFSNEYGFQSLACYDTYREYFKPEEMTLYSEAMVVHQKNPKGYRVIEEYMVRDLPLLKDNFRTYVYLTQILQAEGIKIAMEGHRQKRPWTMGSLYWQVNDCWPVASWSSIDSEMRFKALQYYARRSFAPTALSFEKIDSTATVKLWGVTDELSQKKGSVKLTLMDFSGKKLWSEDFQLDIPSNGNQEIMHATDKELLKGASPREVVLVAESEVDGITMRALYYFVPYKNLKLPKSDFTVDYIKEQGGEVTATIVAKNLVKSVLFEADKLQRNASDAYFDLLPGESRTIKLQFKDDYPVEDLGIFVTSLNEIVGRPSEKPITRNVVFED